jgi:KipI family sensor histidine kinase inhibitor
VTGLDPVTGPAIAVGDAGVLIEVPDTTTARNLASAARAGAGTEVVDVVPGLRSVLVTFDPRRATAAGVAAWLARVVPSTAAFDQPATVVVPTVFDGPDLEEVARIGALDPAEVVARLTGVTLEVAVLGFSPGFAYLEGLPAPLDTVTRRDRPRPSVPGGSVALAGGFAAVYPQPTPGGWHLVGRTGLRLFDPRHPPYARLRPGDQVRLQPQAGPVAAGPAPGPRPVRRVPAGVPMACTVEVPGLLDLVQDLGRDGVAHLGVPRAGAADPVAHRLANALVGNRPTAATIEVTVRGPTLRWRHDGLAALVGFGCHLALDGREVPVGRVVPVAAGQLLAVGPTGRSSRAYLAVRGGFLTTDVLGSASTDVLSWTGPGRLAAGDELGVGQPVGPPGGHLAADPSGGGPADRRVLRVLPGPHLDRLPPGLLDRLATTELVVEATSDRVGLRLHPHRPDPVDPAPGPPDPSPPGLISQGMVTGAVQLPPGGDPIVLLPDHATLGGYPVAAVVIAADLAVLGRCRPGDRVRFDPVTPLAAARALDQLERRLSDAVQGTFPVRLD